MFDAIKTFIGVILIAAVLAAVSILGVIVAFIGYFLLWGILGLFAIYVIAFFVWAFFQDWKEKRNT